MKIKTSELTGPALDWAVGMAIGEYKPVSVPNYSSDWAQAGPIIERENISIMEEANGLWMGSIGGCTDFEMPLYQVHGPTPLIAAMRCYVESKLGDEVEVPEELV